MKYQMMPFFCDFFKLASKYFFQFGNSLKEMFWPEPEWMQTTYQISCQRDTNMTRLTCFYFTSIPIEI